jgi:hypothetical protein
MPVQAKLSPRIFEVTDAAIVVPETAPLMFNTPSEGWTEQPNEPLGAVKIVSKAHHDILLPFSRHLPFTLPSKMLKATLSRS